VSNGNQFNIIEVERDDRSLSTLILSSHNICNWSSVYYRLLINLVNQNGTWTSNLIKSIENENITVIKAKHSSKGIRNRAKYLLHKLI